jgi:hypothetical protein
MERFEVVDQESKAGRSQVIVGLADVQQEERVGLPRPEDHVVVDRPAPVLVAVELHGERLFVELDQLVHVRRFEVDLDDTGNRSRRDSIGAE